MARRKRNSSVLERADRRIESLQSINVKQLRDVHENKVTNIHDIAILNEIQTNPLPTPSLHE